MVRQQSRFGRSSQVLFLGYLLSSIGSGMIFPYMAIYVDQVRGQGATAAAAALALVAAGVVVGSLVAGSCIDAIGPRMVGAIGIALQAVGYPMLGFSVARGPIFAACIVAGLGGGAFLAVLSPSISAICAPDQHRRAFSMRYLINNLGLGVGAAIAALVLGNLHPVGFEALYALNGASYLVLLGCFWFALRSTTAPVGRFDQPERPERTGLRHLLRHRQFAVLLGVQTLLVAGGFSQMQSVVPLFLSVRLDARPALISAVLIVNCIGIVVVQPLVVRLGSRVTEARLLATMGGLWALAFAVGIGTAVGGAFAIGAVIVFGGLFTFGECFYGPTFQPLLVQIAPVDRLGQYSGVSSSVWGATQFVAPPLGVLLVDSAWPYALWVVCAITCAVAGVGALKLTGARAQPVDSVMVAP